METTTAQAQCDVVMKGGITSGVIYPAALVELARIYRFRGLGGASAGAIGAAVGAAAELGRDAGGFDRLAALPGTLGEGRLRDLFQPQPRTRALMRVAAAYLDRGPGAAVLAALRSFALAALLGLLPGLICLVVGVTTGGVAGWLLAALGLVLALLGCAAAVAFRLYRKVTVDLPGNLFGICRGLGDGVEPGFTDWLSEAIDDTAGLRGSERPLLFGDLWSGRAVRPAVSTGPDGGRVVHTGGPDRAPSDPAIDLRMITTCLSYGRPYELPTKARTFFYAPETWATLFPPHVMAALDAGSDPVPEPGPGLTETQWTDLLASRHDPPLRRLPESRLLPVIVATRLSLSFPGLISAVPLWAVDYGAAATNDAVAAFRASRAAHQPPPESGLRLRPVWFSDGGVCSNFPVHFFDAALSSRPTFAINLGSFPRGRTPSADERENVDYAHTNSDSLLPAYSRLPTSGLGAITGFARLAFDTARNWQDSSYLDFPGFRDRIVRVLQTDDEGGLNLDMDASTIDRLGARGRAAAEVMVEQFGQPRYAGPTPTGWDNHRWVRFRALLAGLPDWLDSWARGRAVLDVDPTQPPGYPFNTVAGRGFAGDLADALDEAAAVVARASDGARLDVTGEPNPEGVIRRVPRT